jgi:putative FmdB family regulatory protein
VPTYEYRCPDGHLFEVFKSINAPAPETCPVCGKGPVEVVLHPVAVHFKGSGFYSTDYGRGKKQAKDGEPATSGEKTSDKPAEKAATDSKPKPASSGDS